MPATVEEVENSRRLLHEAVDHACDYDLKLIKRDFPVTPSSYDDGFIYKIIGGDLPPIDPQPASKVFEQFDKITDGLTHWQHPRFFSWFPSVTTTASRVGEILAAAPNIVGFTKLASPAAHSLELAMMDWLVHAMDLPKEFQHVHLSSEDGGSYRFSKGGGCIQETASDAVHAVLVSARNLALKNAGLYDYEAQVGDSSKLVAYVTNHTHFSVEKGAKVAGVRVNKLLTREEDDYGMSPDKLAEAISHDISKGLIPFFVCATVGATGICAVDPIIDIAECLRSRKFSSYKLWMHVDAAYAGSFAFCPEYRKYFIGLHLVDSFIFNPHKLMGVGENCSILFVKDKCKLADELSFTAEYMKDSKSSANTTADETRTHTPESIEPKDLQLALGKRFRSLKLFTVLAMSGISGIQKHLRQLAALAQLLEDKLRENTRVEIVVQRRFSLVCFRLKERDDDVQKLLIETLLRECNAMCSPGSLGGRTFIRVSVGNPSTNEEDIYDLAEAVKRESLLEKME